MEQIGRELGKIYRRPRRLSLRLRALVTQLEPKSRQDRNRRRRRGTSQWRKSM